MAMLVVVLATATYLVLLYPSLPDLLPVHFKASGAPNGWQYRTLPRVLIPVGVQTMLALVLGAVAALLLSRPHGDHDVEAPDVRAAAVAAEAVVLIALVWVAFQAYAGVSLARLWVDPRVRLPFYTAGEVLGGLVSLLVFVRANRLLGRPEPRPFVQSQWRFGQLYKNADDPALFVPTRDGRRWTLNFGRPVAGALLGLILVVGMLGPTLLLALALR
jgi:uncharacterized membrane protein